MLSAYSVNFRISVFNRYYYVEFVSLRLQDTRNSYTDLYSHLRATDGMGQP